jgi:hypothetical protein
MFTVFFLTVLLLLDGLVLLTLWVAYRRQEAKQKRFIWWHIGISLILVVILLVYRATIGGNYITLATRQTLALFFVWVYFSKLLTMLVFWCLVAFFKIFKKKPKNTENSSVSTPNLMNRAQFLERVGVATGGISLGLGFWGTNFALYDYQVRQVPLKIPNLPKAFHGLRIAQISDIHAGSLTNITAVKGGLEMIFAQKPDIICFTGDLVNYESAEVARFEHIFSTIKAPLGVFSCLGNHDYGDYTSWNSPQAKTQNLQQLIEAHKKFGWNLLNDSHTYIEAEGEKIAILGVGNWSKISRFPRYGNLKKAYEGIDKEVSTQILLSHDPTHWDAQVRTQTPHVSLMLAGHTHGMQMGIEWGNFRFSPAQLLFEQWAGLYQKNNQFLYVNRGFGYSDGFPMRLGILPEITIFTLST